MFSRISSLLVALCISLLLSLSPDVRGADENKVKREEYVTAVTRGDGSGLVSWQKAGPSAEEIEFRHKIEARKTALLQGRSPVQHPVLIDAQSIARARANLENSSDARSLVQQWRKTADYIVSQPESYINHMIEELTPWYEYGFTCPNCVGRLTQEGSKHLVEWSQQKPEQISCRVCRHVYPSDKYPESATLAAPRMDQKFTFYFNERERANPKDRSGKLAYKWLGSWPMNMSFSGVIRQRKAMFMLGALEDLAYSYLLTGDTRYAGSVVRILERFTHCYRNWLYHDYWDTIADCDPLFAAWHDTQLPLEFKRNLSADNYRKDTLEKAAMLQRFWGAGKLSPSTDGMSAIATIALAYDLTFDAVDAHGQPLWTAEKRAKVERDLFLEWLFAGEPYLGGPGKADLHNNKTPRIYHAMAAAGRVLGLTAYCEVAMKGYEALRDHAFRYDGFSGESASYTAMYMDQMLPIIERLHGYEWPEGSPRRAMGNPYESDWKLKTIYRAPLDHLTPALHFMPLEDTTQSASPPTAYIEFGLKRYPEIFSGMAQTLLRRRAPSSWALFNLDLGHLQKTDAPSVLPEIYFPSWMTAILRHGAIENGSLATLNFSPDGGHRQADNLALWYMDSGEKILGEIGYIGDTPHLAWLRSTKSHNLVVVDDADQRFRAARPRRPKLEMMFTTPRVSAVEASSDAYGQCRDYRRQVVLLKGPEGRTLLVDIFRVKGGNKHSYRVWSELASSWGKQAELKFDGINMPAEPPLPNVGASLNREDIFGLRDTRGVTNVATPWHATWSEQGRAYRLWNLTSSDKVEASNAPGQQSHNPPGRRVRVLDVIRQGRDLESIFIAVHEPGNINGGWTIHSLRRLDVPPAAGPEAVAVEIKSDWGEYVILSGFENEALSGGIRFAGKLGVIGKTPAGKQWLAACAASTLQRGGLGFSQKPAQWQGHAEGIEPHRIQSATAAPEGFSALSPACQNWLLINDGEHDTGFPVLRAGERLVELTDRFRLPETSSNRFTLPSLHYIDES